LVRPLLLSEAVPTAGTGAWPMSSNAFDNALRKAIDLNVRYYSSMGRLAVDYWRDLFATVTEPVKAASTHFGNTRGPATTAPTAKPAAMVLEAEPESVAQGVFLVENLFKNEVDSIVVASFFKDPRGVVVQPAFAFDPPRVVLKPGEQMLVRVTTTIGAELEPDARYLGEFMVPGLKGTAIPVVLRSRGR
jgi:hypothetical protein